MRARLFVVLLSVVVLAGTVALAGAGAPCVGGRCLAFLASPTATPTPTATATLTPTATATGTATPSPTATATPVVVVVPFGSVDENGNPVPTATPRPPIVPPVRLLELYGAERYPSLDAMPPELRLYVVSTVEAVAEFFEVSADDLLALLQAQNEGALRLHVPPDEGATAWGVAQLSPAAWNGAASPWHDGYARDLRTIEQFGGLGFDWEAREVWRRWQDGERRWAFMDVNADPAYFPNGVAALARFLQREGLTRAAAAADPTGHAARLQATIETLQGERALAWVVDSPTALLPTDGPPTDVPALRAAYAAAMDRTWGVALGEAEQAALVDGSAVARAVAAGDLSVDEGVQQLVTATEAQWLAAGQAAQTADRPLLWPFAADAATLATQRLAVELWGHTLSAAQLASLRREEGDDPASHRDFLTLQAETALFEAARQRLADELGRAVRTSEVTRVVLPAMPIERSLWLGRRNVDDVLLRVEHQIRRLPEFRALHGDQVFETNPLDPMPRFIGNPFGVPAAYQPDGFHTGIDVSGRRVGGEEPLLYAVDEATVTYVGPLYCERAGACRGSHAIVLDHGNNVYSIYSHNSEALVQAGQRVAADQPIGRQGNEGYSRRSHLHFEVHVGAPWSGNWTQPFLGGEFVDPVLWLPPPTDD